MTAPPLQSLVHALLTLCDDAFFAISATMRLDVDALRALAKRRQAAIVAVACGAPPEEMGQGDAWLVRLTAAIAPIAPPRWMPMGNVIEEGLSLEHGARGVRSLFTTKPSEKEVARVRAAGTFAVRALVSVLSAGDFSASGGVLRRCLVASLGLPEEEQRAILAEPPVAPDAIEVPAGIEPKLARSILHGAFTAATLEGQDAREEQAVLMIGRKTGLPAEDITAAHGEARRSVDASSAFGEASVDAIRHVLAGDREESAAVASAVARLTLPADLRRKALEAVSAGAPVVLAKKHAVDRRSREGVLGLAWAAALRSNPSYVRRAELARSLDEVALDLGDKAASAEARSAVEGFLDRELREVIPLAPPPLPVAALPSVPPLLP